jgi:zinc transport system substrate-binding protein
MMPAKKILGRDVLRAGFWIMIMFTAALACIVPGRPALAQSHDVVVSIAPQQYFVERIGGELIRTTVMIPPGASPHAYEPRPEQMRTLAKARAYFAIGVEFEKAMLPKIAAMHPELTIVHTDKDIAKMPMIRRHHDHSEHVRDSENRHGHGHAQEQQQYQDQEHTQEQPQKHSREHGQNLDNHVWLAPELVRLQARTILEALQGLDAAHASVYEANYREFMADLDSLDAEIRAALSGKQGASFMVFHPAWGYFARQYGLRQIPVELEGKEPRAQDLQQLIDQANSEGIKVVFVSPQFSTRSAESIARAINGQTIAINPLAANWLNNMRTVASKFKQAMQ